MIDMNEYDFLNETTEEMMDRIHREAQEELAKKRKEKEELEAFNKAATDVMRPYAEEGRSFRDFVGYESAPVDDHMYSLWEKLCQDIQQEKKVKEKVKESELDDAFLKEFTGYGGGIKSASVKGPAKQQENAGVKDEDLFLKGFTGA